MTAVIVPVTVRTPAELAERAAAAAAAGAGLVELRLDTSREAGADLRELVRTIPTLAIPVLATNRHRAEGGAWDGDEEERLRWLLAAADEGAAWIDVELTAIHDLPHRPPEAEIICSHHDFHGMGSDLEGRIEAMFAAEADVGKLALKPSSAADLDRLHALHDHFAGSPLMLIAMGAVGLPSRLLAGAWGAPFTFARLADDGGSAPGQPTVADLLGTYRLASQGPATRCFGIAGPESLGSPLPRILNAALASHGVDAVCVSVVADELPATGGWLDAVASDGGEDLAERCAALFRRWTGEEPPLAVIRRAVGRRDLRRVRRCRGGDAAGGQPW